MMAIVVLCDLSATGTVSTPVRFDDSKRHRALDDITRQFRYQIESNSCYPTCITNTLMDLAYNYNMGALAFHERDVNKICEYRDWFGPHIEVVVKNLNERLKPLGYSAHEMNGKKYNDLLAVLNDLDTSFPIIGLQQEYLEKEWGIPFDDSRTKPDHTVILLLQNEERMGFYDPYEGRSQRMRQRNQGNGRGVVVLPTPRIMAYWDNAREANWFMWIRKDKPKEGGVQMLIDRPEVRGEAS